MKVSTTQYAKTLFDLTENKSQDEVLAVVKKFAEMLKAGGQLKNSDKIIEKFSELYNTANGIIEAEVISREKLGSELVEKLNVFIKEKYKAKEVVIKNIIDERIKGGIVIKVGDEILDASIANQLKKIKNILSK